MGNLFPIWESPGHGSRRAKKNGGRGDSATPPLLNAPRGCTSPRGSPPLYPRPPEKSTPAIANGPDWPLLQRGPRPRAARHTHASILPVTCRPRNHCRPRGRLLPRRPRLCPSCLPSVEQGVRERAAPFRSTQTVQIAQINFDSHVNKVYSDVACSARSGLCNGAAPAGWAMLLPSNEGSRTCPASS
jgi:hypothetical protein